MLKNIEGSEILRLLDEIENDSNKIMKNEGCLKSPKCSYYFAGECFLPDNQNTDGEIVDCKY